MTRTTCPRQETQRQNSRRHVDPFSATVLTFSLVAFALALYAVLHDGVGGWILVPPCIPALLASSTLLRRRIST